MQRRTDGRSGGQDAQDEQDPQFNELNSESDDVRRKGEAQLAETADRWQTLLGPDGTPDGFWFDKNQPRPKDLEPGEAYGWPKFPKKGKRAREQEEPTEADFACSNHAHFRPAQGGDSALRNDIRASLPELRKQLNAFRELLQDPVKLSVLASLPITKAWATRFDAITSTVRKGEIPRGTDAEIGQALAELAVAGIGVRVTTTGKERLYWWSAQDWHLKVAGLLFRRLVASETDPDSGAGKEAKSKAAG